MVAHLILFTRPNRYAFPVAVRVVRVFPFSRNIAYIHIWHMYIYFMCWRIPFPMRKKLSRAPETNCYALIEMLTQKVHPIMTKGHPRTLSFGAMCVITYKSPKSSPDNWCLLDRRKRRFISSHMAHTYPICTGKAETVILGQFIFSFFSFTWYIYVFMTLNFLNLESLRFFPNNE